MRLLGLAVLALVSCSHGPETTQLPPGEATTVPGTPGAEDEGAPASTPERLSADTPKTTGAGHTFTARAGWSVSVRGYSTIVTAPEGGSDMVFVDVQAKDAEEAVAAAWAEYGRTELPPIAVVEPIADKDGWTDIRRFTYELPPNERRFLVAEPER
jgi:hypothetical protein